MNVMITDISEDLDTTVQGVQTAITLFLLVMAALMIPGGKLTDRYGRKRCFIVGLIVYGVGAIKARSPVCLAACPTSVQVLEPPSPAPSLLPASPRHQVAHTRLQ
jgi:MFS family permease